MKILIVDDDEMSVTVITAILRMAGYAEVAIARDGREGLEKVRAEHPDLVLLDVMLPHMDGYEVCAAVNADPELGLTRVIIITAQGQRSDSRNAIAAGAAAYLTKPFSPHELLAVVKDTLAAA